MTTVSAQKCHPCCSNAARLVLACSRSTICVEHAVENRDPDDENHQTDGATWSTRRTASRMVLPLRWLHGLRRGRVSRETCLGARPLLVSPIIFFLDAAAQRTWNIARGMLTWHPRRDCAIVGHSTPSYMYC